MSELQSLQHTITIQDAHNQQVVLLEDNIYSLGRATDNTIVIEDSLASRYHATILRKTSTIDNQQSDRFWIIDGDLKGNKSTNGIIVNGKKCLSHQLEDGDIITIGTKTRIVYSTSLATELSIAPNIAAELTRFDVTVVDEFLDIAKQTAVGSIDYFEQYTSEELKRLASFPESSPCPILELNLQGKIIYFNRAACVQFSDLIDSNSLNHPLLKNLINQKLINSNQPATREVKVNSKLYQQYSYYEADKEVVKSYIFEINNPEASRVKLKQNEEKYRTIFNQTDEGIFLVDPASKRVIEANQTYLRWSKYTLSELTQLTVYDLFSATRETVDRYLRQIIKERSHNLGEILNCTKDGSLIHLEVRGVLIKCSGRDLYCFNNHDISERKHSEEILQYQAFHDLLTGLPNRELFNKQLAATIAKAKQQEQQIGVMFLDLDRFKKINDSLGHTVGDQLLQRFAQRIKFCLRAEDFVARWGGDEFTIILNNIGHPEEAGKVGERILNSLRPPFKLEHHQLHVRSSIGIAIYPQDGDNRETLLRNAEAALHRTKESGRNKYHYYTPSMNVDTTERLQLETMLYNALARQEFILYYQPQVNIKTKKICGIEALLRWKNPEKGLLSPNKFIELAEEIGLIVPMSEWALQTACEQNRRWQEAGIPPLRVAVNLSPRQFQHGDLVAIVTKVLTQTGLDPHLLELEVTEAALMHNVNYAYQALMELHQLGINFSMDDFGTGYSSLGHLKKFPFQTLKIDQTFVRDLRHDRQNTAIIAAIMSLAQGFNLRIVAEGVETDQQAELLQSLGCYQMQGYRFSHPLTAENATEFLLSHYQNLSLGKQTLTGRNH